MLNACSGPCPALPRPIHEGELSLILDYIPLWSSQCICRKARCTARRAQGTLRPTRQSAHSSLEAVLLQHRISSHMTVVVRINVSPGQGPLGSVSPASRSFFGSGAGGVRWGSVLISNIVIRTRRPWLTVHFLIGHHILFKLSADLLRLTPHSAAKKKKKNYCCVYWGETSQLLLLLLQQVEKTEMLRIFLLVI